MEHEGKNKINTVLKNGCGLILSYDHGLETGPGDFDEKSVDPAWAIEMADSGYFSGFVCNKGIASNYYQKDKNNVPLIVKLNGATSYSWGRDATSLQNCSVDEAIYYGASGVGYNIYLGGQNEYKMLREFGRIEKEAHDKGLFIMVWVHNFGASSEDGVQTDVLSYSARVALELNADAVVTKYTGDPESFSWIIKNAGKTKVFVVGGLRMDTQYQLFDTAAKIKEIGAAGFAIGKSIWKAKDPMYVAKQLSESLYGGNS